MRGPLQEKTNKPEHQVVDKQKEVLQTDKERVVSYMKEMSEVTRDYSLRYDLSKCIEIIEGKENQDVVELKRALENALIENEELYEIRTGLSVENEWLKSQLFDKKV
jgi:uncharacterized protein YqgV (UPF0045/DUF77 family)